MNQQREILKMFLIYIISQPDKYVTNFSVTLKSVKYAYIGLLVT